ncbi:hypothetical protein [Phormidesmis priestleyi]
MAYSDFTIAKVKRDLGITIIEGQNLFAVPLIEPSDRLRETIDEALPIVLAKSSEKSRSELIVAPVLMEVRRQLNQKIGLFSGEEFSVDPLRGLTGVCDFLISRSPEQLEIESPAIVIVEAKKLDIGSGLGQCIAEMFAAQQFNHAQSTDTKAIYGSVTTGTTWKFLKLEETTATVDLTEYYLPPSDRILGILNWMCTQELN